MDNWTGEVHVGDAAETMNQMPESSVHTVVFSPPYWGLRDYGTDGQLGLEETPGQYVSNMVEVGRAVRHVLRDDGSWHLNLGDTFASERIIDESRGESYPAKSKLLIPHRVALSLIDDGWIIRNDNIWRKTNPMPESTSDRRSTTFECVFHLVQNPDYWYDLNAIREPHKKESLERNKYGFNTAGGGQSQTPQEKRDMDDLTFDSETACHSRGKNPGDVIESSTATYHDVHFAVWPEKLVKPLIESSCPENVCSECGKGYSGVAENRKECDCETDETEPGIVLDPFMGSGTTAVVAEKLGRRWVGIDLNDDYVDMSVDRLSEETHYQTESLEKW